ncbi:hypothetical protein C8R47DRAFT_990295 [Mycena vitilis]|nr:hypothetical protein C8R47DRAFT_990295 [Mycena vitilis]
MFQSSLASATLQYQLLLTQQVETAAASGIQSLDRLPLAPPLVVELRIFANGRLLRPDDRMVLNEVPFLVTQLSLRDGEGRDLSMGSVIIGQANARPPLIHGTLNASPQKLKLQGRPGIYFIFSDAAFVFPGTYKLTVQLLKVA